MTTTHWPIHEIKLAQIRASVWANQNGQGKPWYRVTISRVYRDGDSWKRTSSFGRDDLPLVVKAAELAYAWIWNETSSDSHTKAEDDVND